MPPIAVPPTRSPTESSSFGCNGSSFVGRHRSPTTHSLWPFLSPAVSAGHIISSRLYCNPKALWKLNWFLRDFGYDTELLGRDEVDETQLVGLKGVVKISHIVFNGASLLRFDGFASAGRWEELSPANLDNPQVA